VSLSALRNRDKSGLPGTAGEAWTVTPTRYEARQISKSFSGASALRDVSVVLAPGEIHTLVGENGAGKSTLLKVMAGIHQPDHGELVLSRRSRR
jgi:ABC-type sugar transport system ATPase subunit